MRGSGRFGGGDRVVMPCSIARLRRDVGGGSCRGGVWGSSCVLQHCPS